MNKPTLAFILFYLCCCFYACEEPLNPQAVQGYWQDTEDAQSLLYISDKEMTFVYDGKRTLDDTYTYTFEVDCKTACEVEMGKACLVANNKTGKNCYAVLDANAQNLGLVYTTGNGQPLTFKKTAIFDIPAPPPNLEGKTLCYRGTNHPTNKLSMELSFRDNLVRGYLVIQSKNAHTAVGTLGGKIEGNKMILDYNYTIEGSRQLEELMMRIEDNLDIYQAEGELTEGKDGKLVLKDKNNLNYSTLYNKIDCKGVEEQIGWAKGQ